MGSMSNENARSHISKQEMSAVRRSLAFENCQIFFEEQCENTFCMSAASATRQKYRIIFT